MSLLTDAIARQGSLIGAMVSLPATEVSEALSLSGLDWQMFDLEHSVMTLGQVQAMIQAIHPPCLSLVRVEQPSTVYVKKALDIGCTGVIVPQVNNAALAREMVQAAKYPPFGGRSVGLSRSVGYGTTLEHGLKNANSESSLIVQIEHSQAVESVDEIVSIDGVDGIFVGPYDLSGSYGIPGQVNHPRVQDAIAKVIQAARKVKKPAGIFVAGPQQARRVIEQGFDFVAVGADLARLMAATTAMVAEARL